MYCNQREYILSLEIHRDGLYSPWGFRLKGGIDVDGGTPLEIVKVRQKKSFSDDRMIVHCVYTIHVPDNIIILQSGYDIHFIGYPHPP